MGCPWFAISQVLQAMFRLSSPGAALSPKEEPEPLIMFPLLFIPQCLSPSSTPNHSISCHCISLHLTRKVQEEILLCHYLDEKWRFQQVYGSTKAIKTGPNVTKDFVWEPRWLWWLPLIMIVFTDSMWKTTWIYFTDKKYTTSYCWGLDVLKIRTHRAGFCCWWLPLVPF